MVDLYSAWLADEYDVRTASDGTEALDQFDDSVAAVLLDRRMPKRTGDEVLADIREAGYNCHVAMVTAIEPDGDVHEMAFDDYLVEPVLGTDLLDTVGRLLDRRAYDADLREYYALVRERALLDPADPAYATLSERIDALEDRMDETVEGLTDDDYDALFAELAGETKLGADG